MSCHGFDHHEISWQNTLELDRFRRQHAQRHDVPPKSQTGHKINLNNNLKKVKCHASTITMGTVLGQNLTSPEAHGTCITVVGVKATTPFL